jgi:hypothetical protein
MRDQEQGAAIAAATEAAEVDAGREGLVVTFERIVLAGDAAVAAFLAGTGQRMIVGLELAHGNWHALNSRVLGPERQAFQSVRPSEHRARHWTIIAGGLAPDGASRASIALAGDKHVVPVTDGLYLVAISLDREPEHEPLSVSFGV